MRILIAEDEQDLLDQYKLALERSNHTVVLTHDGDECITNYEQEFESWSKKTQDDFKESPYDVVLLDYKMPNKNGLEAAKEILNMCPSQRIIFASAYVESTLQDSIVTLKKIVELMQKPFDLQALVDTIEDKGAFNELEKMNVDIANLQDLEPTHEQVQSYLSILKNLQKNRTFY